MDFIILIQNKACRCRDMVGSKVKKIDKKGGKGIDKKMCISKYEIII